MQAAKENLKLIKLIALFAALQVMIAPVLAQAPGISPFYALALFATAYMGRSWRAYALLICATLLSGAFMSYFNIGKFEVFYTGFYWQLIGYALLVLLGSQALKKITVLRVFGGSIAGVCIFFLISNFGAWATGMYPMNISGLMTCYVNGLPFLKWAMAGTLLFSAAFYCHLSLTKQLKTAS